MQCMSIYKRAFVNVMVLGPLSVHIRIRIYTNTYMYTYRNCVLATLLAAVPANLSQNDANLDSQHN